MQGKPTQSMRLGTKPIALAAVFVLFISRTVSATTYAIPADYSIVSLDLASGKLLWRTKFESLTPKNISAGTSLIRVANAVDGKNYYLDVETGRFANPPLVEEPDMTGPLAPLKQNLSGSNGVIFEFSKDNTKALIGRKNGDVIINKWLESWLSALHIVKNMAIFVFSPYSPDRGTVYAYDFTRDALVWEFDPSRTLSTLHDYVYTDIAIDENHVLVSVDQTIFALSIDSGSIAWMTKLPRQEILRYDSAWTTVGRVGDMLLVQCYGDLFALRAKDGKLLWSFDPGPFGRPWPTLKNGRLYLATREGPVQMLSYSFGGRGTKKPLSIVKVMRDETAENGYSITFMSRDDVPPDAQIWWSLKPPPQPNIWHRLQRKWLKSQPTMLRLVPNPFNELHPFYVELDVTQPLSSSGVVYIKFLQPMDHVVLLYGYLPLVQQKVPE